MTKPTIASLTAERDEARDEVAYLNAQIAILRMHIAKFIDDGAKWNETEREIIAERDEARAIARRLYAEHAKGVK